MIASLSESVESAVSSTIKQSRTYSAYRPTTVWGLERLPDHWREKPLKRVVRINADKLPESTEGDHEIEYVDIGNVTLEKGITSAEKVRFDVAPSRARRLVREGDTIVSTVRTYLKAVAQITEQRENLVVSTGFAVVRATSDLDPGYLFRLIQSEPFIGRIMAQSVGVSYPAINASDIGTFQIQIPPLDEQRRIATYLDRETYRIDELIARKRDLCRCLEEKRTALISHATTHGLNSSGSYSRVAIGWLDRVPAHWRVMPLKLTARSGYKMFTDGDWIEAPYITDCGVRLIQTGNVGTGHYCEQGYRYISHETFSDLRCTEVFPGDVLICRLDGPVGRACVVPRLADQMITSVDNAILRPSSENDARFLVYLMSSEEWLGWIASLCRVGGGFRLRVSRTMLGDFRVPVPPKAEQSRIADVLDSTTIQITKLVQQVESGIAKLSEYRSALISAAVTGQIDVRICRSEALCR